MRLYTPLILFIIVLVAIIGYLIGTRNNQIPSKSTTVIVSPSTAEFLKRQYQTKNKFFSTEEYPQELLRIPDNNLVGMSCAKPFARQVDGSFVYYYADPGGAVKETNIIKPDDKLLKIIGEAAKTVPGKSISTIMICDTQDNRTVVEYEVWAGGGGTRNTSYLGLIDSDGGIKNIVSIPNNDSWPYFGCNAPLQLTNGGTLYFNCRAGDGGVGGEAIYKTDFISGAAILVIKCTSQASRAGTAPTITCK